MLIPVDLHCHSIYSDGSHSIEEVMQLVRTNHGKYIAITDHDTVDGLALANNKAQEYGLSLINGVEISVTWQDNLIHIIGLGVDYKNSKLISNLDNLRNQRIKRGMEIAKKLETYGISGAFDGAMKYCTYPNSLSRTHFAKFLVENGYATQSNVFNKFLSVGKIAYVKQEWASLSDAIDWIKISGGIAIIAHPSRYKLGYNRLEQLIIDFKTLGGIGIEVYSSSHDVRAINTIAKLSVKYNLLASSGNDFHNINAYPRVLVGLTPQLPTMCNTVFDHLGICI